MVEVTNELMHEVLKGIHGELRSTKDGQADIRQEIISLRLAMLGVQNDVHNIYGMLARQDDRLDRIERRLELRELAEAQAPFDQTT